MDNITTYLQALQNTTETFTVYDILLTTILSFVLALFIGYTYQITHKSSSYSQSYVQTVVMMSMVVAVIMLVVGSNIARAFSLVGALSIIRFRNAVKETRDVGYIFFSMAIGMACGTRFYLVGIVATIIICLLMWAMARLDFFAKEVREQLLKIRLPGDLRHEALFDDLFTQYLNRAELIAMETVQAGTLTELIFSVEIKKNAEVQTMFEAIQQLNGNNKVALVTGRQEVDL
ncbi:DUF4956 domain-containing protein [Chloroflexi bacterium TSY]|nr:DUF4956 domain-containing protein [Chloroflexi bacterium TSY]